MSENIFTNWMKSLNLDYWGTGKHIIMPAAFFEKWAKGEAVLLDVRTEVEREHIALPFALHIPIDRLPECLDEVPRDKLVATFCSGGDRAGVVFAYLHAQGFEDVRIFKGGYTGLMAELQPDKLRKLSKSARNRN